MKSAWVDSEAQAAVDRYARDGIARDLALRVYTTRLLGQDPKLVLHGGGNTSVKTRVADLNGDDVEVLCVKGSGWDMGTIEPAGLPAVRLEPLRKLRKRDALTDEDMVRVQRANLIDPAAPNPSVETLLHAFLPHKFVDHTHSTAVLSLTDQPDGDALCAEVYGKRMGYVPYIMPGFALAKAAADVYARDPSVEGLILHRHGIFTFGADAREAYERMIAHVTLAEERLKRGRKAVFASAQLPQQVADSADAAPIIRGACALKDEKIEGAWKRFILEFRMNDAILNFVNGADLARYSQAGVVTPDHTIRTKNWPLILAAPEAGKLDAFRRERARRGRELHRQVPDLFREQQRARRRHQEAARSDAARRAGAGARAVRARPLREGCAYRGRSHGSCDRNNHRRGGDRPLSSARRRQPVRHGILVARTGKALQARRRSRSPDRSWRSPARAAESAPRRRGPLRPRAPKSRCST